MTYPRNTDEPDLSELENIETAAAAPAATLENIVTFATRAKEIDAELATVANYVSTLKNELKDIEETKLPEVFKALGIEKFELSGGYKVAVKPEFQGSLVKEDLELRKQQLDWLIANEGQDLIKNTIVIEFTKGKDAEAKACIDLLKEYEFAFTITESVHAGSLGAFIKEKMMRAEVVPLEELHWRFFNKAEVKPPPKPRLKKAKND